MTDLTVAQWVARALRRHGVEVIFGQSLPSAVILACEAMRELDLSSRCAARAALERRISAAWVDFEIDRSPLAGSNHLPIRSERVMRELSARMVREMIFVADASYSSMWIVGQLRGCGAGQRFLTPRGLAGLGWGLPMAIGAKVARPSSPVVALVGDGGFAHSWAELETMVRSDVAVVTIVLNNAILGFQKDAETVKFGACTSACHFAPVDHASIARACGCGATTVTAPGDPPQVRAAPAALPQHNRGPPQRCDLGTGAGQAHPRDANRSIAHRYFMSCQT